MPLVKDRFFLMLGALIAAGLSWAYWHYTGEDGSIILTTVMLIILFVENNSLRARVQQLERRRPK